MQPPCIPEQAVTFRASQQLSHASLGGLWNPSADFCGEVKQRIDHLSIMAGPATCGKPDMKKRAEARFS